LGCHNSTKPYGKNLLVFVPFILLRFAPQVTNHYDSLSEKELSDFIGQIIVMLSNEVNQGRLTVTQFKDYTKLLLFSAERVFRQTHKHQQEVYGMIKSTLIFPSDEREIALAEKDSALTEQNSLIRQLQTENQRLRHLRQPATIKRYSEFLRGYLFEVLV
jgi:hypothetical protein